MFKLFVCCICIGSVLAHTQEEIQKKGEEVMEEYRTDRGFWVKMNEASDFDLATERLGKEGLTVAGFFIDNKVYNDVTDPGEETQLKDPLFKAFKEMAEDQSWISVHGGPAHKKWVFNYGHDKEVATQAGCDEVGGHPWNHVCIIVAKTDASGQKLSMSHSVYFGHDHTKHIKPTPEDMKRFIRNQAAAEMSTEDE